MVRMVHRRIFAAAMGLCFFVIGPLGARAQVVVYDQVGIVGEPVDLVVRTSGLFSAAGGRRVDFELEGEPPARVMTGADGFGYRRVTPRRTGLLSVEASADGRRGSGRLLVLDPAEPAVLVEVDTALKAAVWGAAERDDCRSALESISRRYRVIYVSHRLGADWVRTRIAPAGLPDSVVLPWKGVALLKSLQNRGVQVAALVGSAAVVSEGRSRVDKRFAFEKSRGALLVRRWAEISEQLDSATPP
ncbi:MAG: hypothetical protein R6V84_10105 [Desulfobacterales bacterium]